VLARQASPGSTHSKFASGAAEAYERQHQAINKAAINELMTLCPVNMMAGMSKISRRDGVVDTVG